MSLVLQSSGGGQITIQEPTTASNFTQDLPAVTGNVVIDSATQTLTNKSIAATQLTGTIAAARLPAGSVLQVVQTVKTNTFSMSGSTFTDITGLSVSITPTSASNKILVLYMVNATATGTYGNIRLVRASTPIYVGDASGNRVGASGIFTDTLQYTCMPINGNFLDSPATTSSTTYKMQMQSGNTSYVNRTNDDRDIGPYDARLVSSITVMEIAG